MKTHLDPKVFHALMNRLEKLAYVPPGPPPPAGMPMGDPSQAAAAPMSAPPPGAPGMDPAMAGGGMPPGGAPAGMDPNMMAALAGALGGGAAPGGPMPPMPPGAPMPPDPAAAPAPEGAPVDQQVSDAAAQNKMLVEKLDTVIDMLKQVLEKSGNPQAKTLITPEATAAAEKGVETPEAGVSSESAEQPPTTDQQPPV